MRFVALVRVLASLVLALLAVGAHSNLAHAQSASDQARRSIVLPSVRAATDCIAASVSRQPGVISRSPDSTLSEAIRRVLAGGVCDGAVTRMVAVYDQTYGPGTGPAFFSGPYGNDLTRAVRSRLTGTHATTPNPTQATAPNTIQNAIEDRQAPLTGPRVVQPSQTSPAVIAAPTASNSSLPKTRAEIEAQRAFNVFMGNIAGIFALAFVATFVLFLIGLGSRWVVFTDGGDLGRTALIVITPIVTALAIAFEAWRLSLNGSINVPIYDFVTGHWTVMVILMIGTLVWIWGFVWTFFSSIMCNGLIVGSSIAILKITAILCMSLALFGTLYLGEGKEGRHRAQPNFAMWLVFGLIIWFASKLVNGYRVAERRESLLTFQGVEAA